MIMWHFRSFSFVILSVVLVAIAACAPAAAPAMAPATEATSAPAEEEAVAPVELLFWHTFESRHADALETLLTNFEAENPHVTISAEFQDFDNMKTIVKIALASGTGPDLVVYGPGAGFMGPLVEAELLLPLDQYSQQYGWQDHIYQWTFESTSFDGSLYAIGNELEFIGIYYNKAIFAELGVSEPETYEELLQIGEKALSADYIPISFVNKPGWPAFHVFSAFANNLAGKEGIEAAIFGDASWAGPEFIRAIEMPFVELNQANFFVPSPNALDYDEGNNIFYAGQAAMHLTGTWLVSRILDNADFEVGFFALPSIDGSVVLPPGGMGSAVMISAATSHPDEAAALLDFLFAEESARTWIEEGNVIPPIDVDPSGFELPGLFQFVIDTVRANSTSGGLGLGYNIDVLTPPEFNTAMRDGFQAVLEGTRSPQEQAEALQAAKEAGK
jgi:raffinose/stachyose/melibiose transport system substrate-binding protein